MRSRCAILSLVLCAGVASAQTAHADHNTCSTSHAILGATVGSVSPSDPNDYWASANVAGVHTFVVAAPVADGIAVPIYAWLEVYNSSCTTELCWSTTYLTHVARCSVSGTNVKAKIYYFHIGGTGTPVYNVVDYVVAYAQT